MAQKWPKITPNGPKMTPEFKHFFRIRQICQQSRRPTNWFRNKVVEGGFFRKLSEISFSFKHQSFVRVEWVSVLADCSHTHRGQTTKTTNKLGRNERTSFFSQKSESENWKHRGLATNKLVEQWKGFSQTGNWEEKRQTGATRGSWGQPMNPPTNLVTRKEKVFFSQREI